MPSSGVQRTAWEAVAVLLDPTTIEPSAEMSVAMLKPASPPGSVPRSIIPSKALQRKARDKGVCPWPTTTVPSPETARPSLSGLPPGRSPTLIIPSAAVQRYASLKPVESLLRPVTDVPSPDTAQTVL